MGVRQWFVVVEQVGFQLEVVLMTCGTLSVGVAWGLEWGLGGEVGVRQWFVVVEQVGFQLEVVLVTWGTLSVGVAWGLEWGLG